LSGSDSGVYYQLFNGTATVGSPVLGTGSAIDFGTAAYATGTYTVSNTPTGGYCISDMTGSVSVTANTPPTATVSGGGTICSGSPATISAALTGTGPWLVKWSDETTPDDVTSSPDTRTVSPATTTTYTVTSLTDSSGCGAGTASGSATVTLATINTIPTATVSGTATICKDGTTAISAVLTGIGPWNVTWSDGHVDSGVTSPDTRTVSPAATTTYTVTNLTDTGSCSTAGTSSGSAAVTVDDPPTATVSGGGTIYSGGAATVSAALTGIGPWTVTWSDGHVDSNVGGTRASSYMDNYPVSPAATTVYTVTSLVDAGSCSAGTASGSATVTVNPVSTAPLTAAPTNTLLWLQGGHAGKVNAVSWSSDGSFIASASDDATVKLWNTNGGLVRTFNTHPYQATAVAFSPDSTRLAIGANSGGYLKLASSLGVSNGLGMIFLWQASSGGLGSTNVSLAYSTTNRYGKIESLAFSPDGTKLGSGVAGGSNYIQNAATGTALASSASYAGFSLVSEDVNAHSLGVAFSSGGLFASACEDGTLRVWNSANAQVWSTNTAQASNITSVAFSPDGTLLASASEDGTIMIWATNTWSCVQTLTGHTGGVTAVAFSPNGNLLASGGEDQTVRFWNVSSGTCLLTATGHTDVVTSVAFSPDGSRVVSGSQDNTIRIWSTAKGSLLQTCGAHTDFIKAVAVSPDGTLCADASNDRTIQVRRMLDGLLLQTLPGNTGGVSAIAFGTNSSVLASGGGPLDPTIKLWRISDGALLQTINATTNGVMALAFSPDGSTIASGGDGSEQVIRLWNAAAGTNLLTLAGHSGGVTALAFSAKGDLLASGGRNFDATVKVWAVTNGSLLQTFPAQSTNYVQCVAFSPDGTTVASGSSDTNVLELSSLATGTSRFFGSDTNPVFFVAFSPDGSTLAAPAKNIINFWNVTNGAVAQTATQETFRASCFAYAPGGKTFVYGREDASLALSYMQSLLGTAPVILFQPAGSTNSPGTNATFTVVVSASPPFYYQWLKNGTNTANGGNVSGANTASLTLYDVQNADAAGYSVVITNTAGCVTSSVAALTLTTNAPPVAGTDIIYRPCGVSLKISIADLLTNDIDTAGNPITFAGTSSTSTNGVPITTNNTTIFYPAVTNADDAFAYTITDGLGNYVTGTVLIRMASVSGCDSEVSLLAGYPGPGSNTVTFLGVPGYHYVVQFATNLSDSPWFCLCTNTTPTNGLIFSIDPAANTPQRYYRLLTQ
jgi:WD40 repeat protein